MDVIISETNIGHVTPEAAMQSKELRHRVRSLASKIPAKSQEFYIISRFENGS
jgi:hypothetical protein